MTMWTRAFAGIAVLLMSLYGPAVGASKPFGTATVHMEQNATDGDFEVVFEVLAGDEGLAKLVVTSPDGRKVVDFTAPGAPSLGIRQFRMESPEPEDFESLEASYPEGVYTFAGVTAAGDSLHGKSSLSHDLPAPATILSPKVGDRNVPSQNLEIRWTPANNVSTYVVELSQQGADVSITARLPGTSSAFAVPQGFIEPGKKYQLGIGAVMAGGSASYVETTFTAGAGQE